MMTNLSGEFDVETFHELLNGVALLALAFPLVQHAGQRLQFGQGQLQGHAVGVAGRRALEEILGRGTSGGRIEVNWESAKQ